MILPTICAFFRRKPKMLPVHYQPNQFGWPVCGERPISYDSTAHRMLVTCPRCLAWLASEQKT